MPGALRFHSSAACATNCTVSASSHLPGRRQAAGCLLGLLAGSPLARAQQPEFDRVPPLDELVNVFEFDGVCKLRATREAYDYVSGGADDEVTLRRNRQALSKITFRPRMLSDVSQIDLSTTLFGQKLPHPILVAPTGTHSRLHPEGELATVRGASRAGAVMVVSSSSSFPIDQIARAATVPLWFQLYAGPDKEGTFERVARALEHGCKTVCFTVDVPYFPHRERDLRNRLIRPEMEGERRRRAAGSPGFRYRLPPRFTSELTWPFVTELADFAKAPVLIKGILTAEDARLAVEHGAAGIVVSNHGGRYLDSAPATIAVLPEIVSSVGGRIPVLIDGGFRRGADILKALALGAKAVLLGRPPLWGLGAYGEAGVTRILQLLETELALAMGLAGRSNLGSLDPSLVRIEN